MATKKPVEKTVTAFLRINLEVGIDLGRTSLEDALAHAKTLKVVDVLDLAGLDHNDSDITVTGVFQNNS